MKQRCWTKNCCHLLYHGELQKTQIAKPKVSCRCASGLGRLLDSYARRPHPQSLCSKTSKVTYLQILPGVNHVVAGTPTVEQIHLQQEAEKNALGQREEMIANRAKYLRHQANLLKAIREESGCWSLYEDLKEIEGKIDRIDERLADGEREPLKPITLDEVSAFVNDHLQRFEELLFAAPERVKAEFQRRISSITMTPGIDERGAFYAVSGDVDLFSVPQDAVQTNPVDLIALHYNLPITFNIHAYANRPKWTLPIAA